MGLPGWASWRSFVPHSIVVGFTIGIAVTIALSQVGEVLGLHAGFKLTEHELVELQRSGVPASRDRQARRRSPTSEYRDPHPVSERALDGR